MASRLRLGNTCFQKESRSCPVHDANANSNGNIMRALAHPSPPPKKKAVVYPPQSLPKVTDLVAHDRIL